MNPNVFRSFSSTDGERPSAAAAMEGSAIIFFVLDLAARFIHLAAFNYVGRPLFILVLVSIVLDCSTRTLTRILTLFVCMGCG